MRAAPHLPSLLLVALLLAPLLGAAPPAPAAGPAAEAVAPDLTEYTAAQGRWRDLTAAYAADAATRAPADAAAEATLRPAPAGDAAPTPPLASADAARPALPPATPRVDPSPAPEGAATVQVPAPAFPRALARQGPGPDRVAQPAPGPQPLGAPAPCDSPLDAFSGVAFLIVTQVPGFPPVVVPGVPVAPNLVHADVPIVGGTGDPTGLDLVLQVTADLTLQRITVRLDRPATKDLPPPLDFRPLPALDVRLVVPLSGGPEPGLVPQGCLRDFVYAGYRYADPQGQPGGFAVTVDFSSVGANDETLELLAEFDAPPPDLTIFGGLFAAETAQGARARSFDAEAALHGLPPAFETAVRLRSLATPASNTTVADWRASADLAAVEVALVDRDGPDSTSTMVQVQQLPRRVSLTLDSGAAVAAAYDASAGIPDLRLSLRSTTGPATVERLDVHATQVPAHALLSLRSGALTYAGDTPLGVVEFAHGTWEGPFPTLPGEHLVAFDDGAGRQSISARVTGLQRLHYTNETGMAVEARVAGGVPFIVVVDQPTLYAEVLVDPLPSTIDVRTDLAGEMHYRASDPIDLLTGKVEAAPLFVDFVLTGLPRSVDVSIDTVAGQASVVLDEPLDSVDANVLNTTGFNGTPYKRLRVHVEDLPGLAANWSADGKAFAVQAIPPGASIEAVEVELSATDAFLGFADPGTHYALIKDFPGQAQASLRVLDFAAASADMHRGLDLRWITGVSRPLVVSTDGPTEQADVRVEDLPAALRFTSDLNTTFAYNASSAIAKLTVTQLNKTTSNLTAVVVDTLPQRFTVLLDAEGGAAAFDPGPVEQIGSVQVTLERPSGLGEKKIRSIAITVEGIPGLDVRWGGAGTLFVTDGRPLKLAQATISTQLPPESLGSLPLAAGVHLDGDYVVVMNNTSGPESLDIYARIRGLRTAGAEIGEHRMVGDVQLAAPQHFDLLFLSRFGACLERRVAVHVDPLPSFNVTTDLASAVHYHAGGTIDSIQLLVEEEQAFLGLCLVEKRLHLTIDDVPQDIDVGLATEPLLARYRAATPGPAGAPDVFLDLLDLDVESPGAFRRVNVTVRDIPRNLAIGFNNATKSGLFEADLPVGVVEVRAGNSADPPNLLEGRPEAHVAIVHDEGDIGGEVVVAMRVTGLRAASFAMGQKAIAGDVEAQAGALYLDVLKEDRIDGATTERSAVQVTVADVPDRLRLSTDGGSFFRLAASDPVAALEVHACSSGDLGACGAGTLVDVVLADIPPTVDIGISGPGLDLAFDGGHIGAMDVNMRAPFGLFDDHAADAVKQIRVGLAPVPEGHVHFGDAHDLDIDLAEAANVQVFVTNTLVFEDALPASILDRLIADHANPFYADNHVYVFEGMTFAVAEGQLGPTDTVVDVRLGASPGQGVRSARVSMHTNPAVIDLAMTMPAVTLAKWERHFFTGNLANVDGVFPPEVFLSVVEPPERLKVTVEKSHPTHLVDGYQGDWRGDDYPPLRQADFRGEVDGSAGATGSTIVIDSQGSGTGGATYVAMADTRKVITRFTDPPEGGEVFAKPKGASMFFGFLPSTVRIQSVDDPRVYDREVARDGAYGATDLQFAQAVPLAGFQASDDKVAILGGTISRLFTDNWTDYDQDTCDVGVSIPNAWTHLRVEGSLDVEQASEGVEFDWNAAGPSLDLTSGGDATLLASFQEYAGTLWVHQGEEACDNGQTCNQANDGFTIGIAQPIPIVLWYYDNENDCEGLLFGDLDPFSGDLWTVS